MSARDVWGFSIIRYFIVGLSCVRAAYVHDVCVWFWRASRRSCQVGARCGHFGWRVLLTAALSCRPLHSFTAPFWSEMSGASALGTCVFSLARASAALCTTCACGRRASCDAALGRCMVVAFAWLVLLTNAPSCRPLSSITAPCRPEMSGASALGTLCFTGKLVRQSRLYARRTRVALACELAQLYRYCAVVALSGECRWPLR